LQFYVATGRRRAEVVNLRGSSIEIKDGRFFIKARVKGGFFLNFELDDETTKNALFAYLEATNRSDIFGINEPIWLRLRQRRSQCRGKERLNLARLCPTDGNLCS